MYITKLNRVFTRAVLVASCLLAFNSLAFAQEDISIAPTILLMEEAPIEELEELIEISEEEEILFAEKPKPEIESQPIPVITTLELEELPAPEIMAFELEEVPAPEIIAFELEEIPDAPIEAQVDIVAPTGLAPEPILYELPEEVSVEKQTVSYNAWYEVAAEALDIPVTEVTASELSLKQLAKANKVKKNAIIKAIYSSENAVVKQWKKDGLIDKKMQRNLRQQLYATIRSFVNATPADLADVTVDDQEAIWESFGFENYQYDTTRYCYCYGDYGHQIIVRDGAAFSAEVTESHEVHLAVEMTEDGEIIEVEPPARFVDASAFPTIPEMFERVRTMQEQDMVYLGVEYHPVYGFPVNISSDYSTWIADDELTTIYKEFVPLTSEG